MSSPATLAALFRDVGGHRPTLYRVFLAVLADDLESEGVTADICRDHLDAGQADVVHLRLLGGLQRIVLEGRAPTLEPWYDDPDALPAPEEAREVLLPVLAAHAEELARALDIAPQTNEVGRSACLAVGLFAAVRRHRTGRVRLLEPGASAGLNLNVDHYRVVGPDWSWGPADSPVVLDTQAAGILPEPVEIVERRGCDLAPVDAADPAGAVHLTSFVWPFHRDRRARLTAALAVARAHPVVVDRAPASQWLAEQLTRPAEPGVLTVVWQSITQQYWPAEESEAVAAVIERAREHLRLAHISMEGVPPVDPPGGFRLEEHGPELRLDGELLARSGFHGPPLFPAPSTDRRQSRTVPPVRQ